MAVAEIRLLAERLYKQINAQGVNDREALAVVTALLGLITSDIAAKRSETGEATLFVA